jgi:hydroxyethylthiazole kinase-like uncharacterized protein yjeF
MLALADQGERFASEGRHTRDLTAVAGEIGDGVAAAPSALCQAVQVTAESLDTRASDDLRAAEQRVLTRLPEGTLMDRAAARLAVVCAQILRQAAGRVAGKQVVLLVGSGNNGGDALLAGARLSDRGAQVRALLVGKSAHERGIAEFGRSGGRSLVVDDGGPTGEAAGFIARADLIVDGITGISGSPGLRSPALELVEAFPAGVPVVAVDLPSGVDPETGETPNAHIVADVTVAFGALHPCLLLPPGAHAAGRLIFADVGVLDEIAGDVPVRRLTDYGIAAKWPVPEKVAHKYLRGVLGVVAGSDAYPGAAVLACAGAIRAGVGIVRYVGPQRVTDHVLTARPEAVPGVGRVQAWLLGSGVEDDPTQDDAIGIALASGLPCVVDAGALDACVRRRADGDRPAAADAILLTPHAGELARMLVLLGHSVTREEVEARPLHHGRWLACETASTVLVKGSTTLIVGPIGPVYSQADGPAWMATAGSGDVLAGIAGALMAGGLNALDAGAMAAAVHGKAGARASRGGPLAAMDIAEATPATVVDLLQLTRTVSYSG